MAKVWLITGTSKGFGRIWAQAARLAEWEQWSDLSVRAHGGSE
jgi:hypothetical protein